MGLPNHEQYIRGMALESATKIVSSGCLNPTDAYGSWTEDELLNLSDRLADYIQYGRDVTDDDVS